MLTFKIDLLARGLAREQVRHDGHVHDADGPAHDADPRRVPELRLRQLRYASPPPACADQQGSELASTASRVRTGFNDQQGHVNSQTLASMAVRRRL